MGPVANNTDHLGCKCPTCWHRIQVLLAAAETAKRHRSRPCTSPGDPGNCSLCSLAKVVYGET